MGKMRSFWALRRERTSAALAPFRKRRTVRVVNYRRKCKIPNPFTVSHFSYYRQVSIVWEIRVTLQWMMSFRYEKHPLPQRWFEDVMSSMGNGVLDVLSGWKIQWGDDEDI